MKFWSHLRALFLSGLSLALAGCMSTGVALVNLPSSLKSGYSVYHATYDPASSQGLDIYVPSKSNYAQNDVIVFFYGGRWEGGTKEDFRFVGATLAQRGFVAVIADYRKYPAVRFPVFVEDGAKAVAWVDDHIAEYGGRRDRIHLAGHSSGAHIASLLTVDERYLAKEGKNSRTVIRDFAGLAGPYSFTPEDKDLVDMFGPPENYQSMQATSFIDGQEPPMLLMYGEDDTTVKPYNYQRLAKAVQEKGGRVKTLTYPGLGHIGIIATFSPIGPTSRVVDDMTEFFRTDRP